VQAQWRGRLLAGASCTLATVHCHVAVAEHMDTFHSLAVHAQDIIAVNGPVLRALAGTLAIPHFKRFQSEMSGLFDEVRSVCVARGGGRAFHIIY
jgi:hypothetical protein